MDCSFCGREISRGTESVFVTKRGKALYFCSGKCEKNMLKLGRKPRETRWTLEYRDEKAIRNKPGAAESAAAKERREKEEKAEEAVKEMAEDKTPKKSPAKEAEETKKKPAAMKGTKKKAEKK